MGVAENGEESIGVAGTGEEEAGGRRRQTIIPGNQRLLNSSSPRGQE